MYEAETLRKGGLNSYFFFSLFSPVFRSLHLHCRHTAMPMPGGCWQGRAVGHAAAQRWPWRGPLIWVTSSADHSTPASFPLPASQTQHTGGFWSKLAGCGWRLRSETVGQRPPGCGANAPGLRGSTSKIQLFHGKVVGHSHANTAAHC